MPVERFYREGFAEERAEAVPVLVTKREEYLLAFKNAFRLGVGNPGEEQALVHRELNAMTNDVPDSADDEDE